MEPGIDSEESILPAYVAWRAGTTPIPTQFLAPIDFSTIPALYTYSRREGGGESLARENVREETVYKDGSKIPT
jgi:hypothetical protein